MSRHWLRKYPNLIRDLEVVLPEELWVADITYLTLENGFCYLSLITDAYSRKIVGHCLSRTLEHHGPLEALKYALSQRQYPKHPLIHHSDRGIQYCCKEYINCLFDKTIKVSMTEKGDPYENAIAERVNGILKDEFYLDRTFKSYEQALLTVKEAVDIYNNFRPHASCNYLTPEKAHLQNGPLKHRWKKYYKTNSNTEKVF